MQGVRKLGDHVWQRVCHNMLNEDKNCMTVGPWRRFETSYATG